MYTNIDTKHALDKLKKHCNLPEFVHEALKILMTSNVFQFSDSFWIQRNGTAMGVSPACMWATLYFSPHERRLIAHFTRYIILGKRYIDDVIGIWNFTNAESYQKFAAFKAAFDKWGKLRWDFSTPSKQVNFLDMTIAIVDGRIRTTLFEKSMHLYLYLPPHSAHPPGVLTGIIAGTILRIFCLTSDKQDTRDDIQRFYDRLRTRGYKPQQLLPIFHQFIKKLEIQDQLHQQLAHVMILSSSTSPTTHPYPDRRKSNAYSADAS